MSLPIVLLFSWKCSDIASRTEAWRAQSHCTSIFVSYFAPSIGLKNVKVYKDAVCSVSLCACVTGTERSGEDA